MADVDHALTFRDAEARQVYERVVEDVEDEHARSVALVVPEGPVYPLPAYELALMSGPGGRVGPRSRDFELSVVTPEPSPLAAFGGDAGDAVERPAAQAGVELYVSSSAFSPAAETACPSSIWRGSSPWTASSRCRASPGLGSRAWVATGAQGFIPIDAQCAVPGTDGKVFAAGDATASRSSTGVSGRSRPTPPQRRSPGSPVPGRAGTVRARDSRQAPHRGKPLYLSARLVNGQGFDSTVSESPPWPVDDKIVAAELGPYIAGLDSR